MNDPWAFGWTQLLTVVGFIITISIAIGGFRTFNRWKREKIEETKIETAFEALAFAYEATYAINAIRAPIGNPAEWSDMPQYVNETEDDRRRRAPAYVVWKRMQFNSDFFQRLQKLQPRVMAIFGSDKENVFGLIHISIIEIQMASWIRGFDGLNDADAESQRELEEVREKLQDIFMDDDPGVHFIVNYLRKRDDRLNARLFSFREEMESFCKPIVDRSYLSS